MKHATVISLALVLTTLGCTKDPIAPASLSNNPLETQLDQQVEAIVQKHRQELNTVGLTIGIWKAGKNHIYGYGETRQGSQQIPDAHTFFEIGSITKTFTAAAMVQWLNEKGLRINDPIQPFLPPSIPALSKGGVAVSFQQILNHSSGIAYFPSNLNLLLNDDDRELARYSEAKLFDYLDKGKLNAIPGTTYEYSNTAMGLAGTILSRENGLSYGEYLQRKVCEPLGLLDTKAQLNTMEKKRMSDGHRGGKRVDFWESLGALDGAGVLRSTTSDLLKYGAACIDPPNTPLGQAMRTCQVPTLKNATNLVKGVEVGLGWHLLQLEDQPGTLLFHDGATGGFNCSLMLDQAKKLVLVVCYNSYNASSKVEAEARTALNNDLLLLLR